MNIVAGVPPTFGAAWVLDLLQRDGASKASIKIVAESLGPEQDLKQALDENIMARLTCTDPDLAMASFLCWVATGVGFPVRPTAHDVQTCTDTYLSLNAIAGSYEVLLQSRGLGLEVRVSKEIREHVAPSRVVAAILMDMATRLRFDAAVAGRGDRGLLWPGVVLAADGTCTEIERPSNRPTAT